MKYFAIKKISTTIKGRGNLSNLYSVTKPLFILTKVEGGAITIDFNVSGYFGTPQNTIIGNYFA